MGRDDHYIFMDGCVVKGCKPFIAFEKTFGEYAALLRKLYMHGHWGRFERRFMGLHRPAYFNFGDWVQLHVHTAQSTQNIRTGADRIDRILKGIRGHGDIHMFGTSAAGSAMLEYFLLTDPDRLYYHPDNEHELKPAKKYDIDVRIASLTTIDAPTNWVPLRHDSGRLRPYYGRDALGRYLAGRTRIKAGPRVPPEKHTTRTEDVPNTWVEAEPVAGLDYDDRPHYEYLPKASIERHIYTGSHMSHETREFLERIWR